MPRLKLPDHVKREYAEKAESEKEKRYRLRQLAAEDTSNALARSRHLKEARHNNKIHHHISEKISDSKVLANEKTNELELIETELSELQLDIELSTNGASNK